MLMGMRGGDEGEGLKDRGQGRYVIEGNGKQWSREWMLRRMVENFEESYFEGEYCRYGGWI